MARTSQNEKILKYIRGGSTTYKKRVTGFTKGLKRERTGITKM
jgi:hypothetical protein